MATKERLSRSELADRWGVTTKTVDRLRVAGILPWVDLAAGRGAKPLVRFLLADIIDYEVGNRKAPFEKVGGKHEAT